MLETRELYKVYKPKKGVPVTALNHVSLKFPERGMVFLLGKSGSGKSTLLNLLGGLDKYDDGEIIIKGVSSKDFNQGHFDSYRNTYVGFIFQEYNILEEFSVGANIALALELQGKKATDEDINRILKEVDLEGYGNRKPNELSGGQKQRVAIARALVKNPQIIMADEPTGALDSNTGRQVFDTLKKLSKEKLVIIVSHDREFSELYADRIIELSDGNVISDVELDETEVDETSNLMYEEDVITIAPGYHLTEEDRIAINAYMDELAANGKGLKLGVSTGNKVRFKETDQDAIQMQDGSGFSLIKSKLPMKNAFKIGASSLKHKKFRLVMTIILSCVAFVLFGLADTFASYNHVQTSTNSIMDTGITHLSLKKAIKCGEGIDSYWDSWDTTLGDEEIQEIEKNTNIEFEGVVVPNSEMLEFLNYDDTTEFTEGMCNVYSTYFNGYSSVNEGLLKEFGYEIVAGKLPEKKNEAAISAYVFETFKKGKYTANPTESPIKYETVENYEDMIGKTIIVGTQKQQEYVITGIVDTKFDFARYQSLGEKKEHVSTTEELVDYALMNEFYSETEAGLATVLMVSDEKMSEIIAERPKVAPLRETYVFLTHTDYSINPNYFTRFSDVDKEEEIVWLDGERTTLGENEIIVNLSSVNYWGDSPMVEDIKTVISSKPGNITVELFDGWGGETTYLEGYKIVGLVGVEGHSKYGDSVIVNDDLYYRAIDEDYVPGTYSYIVGAVPEDEKELKDVLSYCYQEDGTVQYQAQNAVSYELDTINEVLKVLAKVFLYIGCGFALFAALMLANFIATSISYKKQEIGILRAIGSRSNDVFRIFFSESFVIAMINFVISSIGVGVVVGFINSLIRKELYVLVTVLDFGVRQIGLLFLVSVGVAFLASFIPVKKIASKRPIDAIRKR